MSFEAQYIKYKQLFSGELSKMDKIILDAVSPREELKTPLLNFLNSPSKRIRPVLAMLYLKALEFEISEDIVKLLSAVEIIHNASLVHDDIIDESEFRRGDKTLSQRFGNKLGVIAGDYLLSLAMGIISNLGDVEILREFSATLKQMCLGEINQNFDLFKIGTIENYIEKSQNKTAYLFKSAIVSPLILSKKSEEIIERASDFALNFGVAFQIRDDLINITKSDHSKPYGNDIAEGIYNAPVIYAGGVENLPEGIEKTRILLNNYVEKALLSLEKLPNNDYKTLLVNLTELNKDV